MKSLIKQIEQLKDSSTSNVVNKRIKEFENITSKDRIFSELCFCLLTANFQAEKSIKIQKELGEGLFNLSEKELAGKLKTAGHRFWPQRATRIVKAREIKTKLYNLIQTENEFEIRNWIVENVKGLGMKESSHFLRNIGYKNLAIIDFHIVDLLVAEKLIEKPKTITPKRYLEIESTLNKLARKVNLNLAELDLYLWYIETGKILK